MSEEIQTPEALAELSDLATEAVKQKLNGTNISPPDDPPVNPIPSPDAKKISENKEKDSKRSKSKPVVVYVSVMFAAALFLMIFSFLMQQRNHEALMKGLSSTAVSTQSIVNLTKENDDLQTRLDEMQEELDVIKTDTNNLQQTLTAAEHTRDALTWLQMIQTSYLAKDYQTARAQMAEFEASGLRASLPVTATKEGVLSPSDAYADLFSKLNKS
ncbi:MAG: hypothetical protein RR053_00700 [Evtepia sp.]